MQQKSLPKKWVSPTYVSSLFSKEPSESQQSNVARPGTSKASSDLSREQLFGVQLFNHYDTKPKKPKNKEIEGIQKQGANQQIQNQSKQSDLLPYNAMWWQPSKVRPSSCDLHAKQRKLNEQKSDLLKENNIKKEVPLQEKEAEVAESKISDANQNENNNFQTFNPDHFIKEKLAENLSDKQIRRSVPLRKEGEIDLLAANASQFSFDSCKYNPKATKKRECLSAKQRRENNTISVLDQVREKKVGIQNLKSNQLGLLREKLNSTTPKAPRKTIEITESEIVTLIELRSLPTKFDVQALSEFCALKGFKMLALKKLLNAKGELYVKQVSKFAEPIEQIQRHLLLNSATIMKISTLSPSEFNKRKLKAPLFKGRPLPLSRRHYPPQEVTFNIFSEAIVWD